MSASLRLRELAAVQLARPLTPDEWLELASLFRQLGDEPRALEVERVARALVAAVTPTAATGAAERSYRSITPADLDRLSAIAAEDRGAFFRRNQRWDTLYRERSLGVPLCQGAAQHYVDDRHGVKD